MSDEKPDDERPIPYTLAEDALREIANDPRVSARVRIMAAAILARREAQHV